MDVFAFCSVMSHVLPMYKHISIYIYIFLCCYVLCEYIYVLYIYIYMSCIYICYIYDYVDLVEYIYIYIYIVYMYIAPPVPASSIYMTNRNYVNDSIANYYLYYQHRHQSYLL